MIAPLREPSERVSRRRNDHLDLARRIVAAALLPDCEEGRGSRVSGWKAWLFALWMLFAAIAYGLSMLGCAWF